MPEPLHLESGLEWLVSMTREITERDRIDVPPWIADAVGQTMIFAVREKCCILPGHEADLSHGHLLVVPEVRVHPLTAQMELAQGILFHSQECIDATRYHLDPARRNILFNRITGQVKILDPRDYDKVTDALAIDPNIALPNLVAGETIVFRSSHEEGLIFASWGRERPFIYE